MVHVYADFAATIFFYKSLICISRLFLFVLSVWYESSAMGSLVWTSRYPTVFSEHRCYCYMYKQGKFSFLKVALHVLGRKIYKNTKKSFLYTQSLLIFIHRAPVDERHPITRRIRDLLWPRSTKTGNTIFFYMSSPFICTLKIHRRSFEHGGR